MPFAGTSSAVPYPVEGELYTPMSGQARVGQLIVNLRGSAASAANMRDPITAALSTADVCDIRGVTSFRLFGRVKNVASLNFSTSNPKVAVYLVWVAPGTELVLDSSGIPTNLASIASHIERVDQDGSATDGGIEVPFYNGAAQPSSSNTLVNPNGNWLTTKALQYTNFNGETKQVFDARGAAFALAVITSVAGGAAATGESSELILEGCN